MDHRGISAVSGAVALLLDRAWDPPVLDGVTPEFAVHRSRDLAEPMSTGLSVLVHRVSPTSPAGQRRTAGTSGTTLEVHLLLVSWGASAADELSLLGWGACVLADHAVLDAALLNEVAPGVCPPGDAVQLRAEDLDPTVSGLWSVLPCSPQPSLAFVAGPVHLTGQ